MKEEIIASLMTGTSNVSLDKDDLYDIEIPFPKIEIQNEIVASQLKIENEIKKMQQKIHFHKINMINEGKKIWS